MTNSQPEDISTRLGNIDEQLEQVLDEIDLIRTIQNGNRREIRATSQTAARLERTVNRLAEIAALHQQALMAAEPQIRQNQADIRQNQENIDRILQYLENPHRGDSPPN